MNKLKSALKQIPSLIKYIAVTIFKTAKDRRFWIALAFILWTYLISWFFSNYYLTSGIKKIEFQCVVCSRYKVPVKTEKRTTSQTVSKSNIAEAIVTPTPDVAENIYQMTREFESNKGTNPTPYATHNYCKSIGFVNEIGYFPDGNKKFCFKDEADQKYTFMLWLNKRLDNGYTLKEAICEYTNGRREPMCQRTIDMGL